MLVVLTATIPYLYKAIALAIRNNICLVLSFASEDETARSRNLLVGSNSRILGLSIDIAGFDFVRLLGLGLGLILSNSFISELFVRITY